MRFYHSAFVAALIICGSAAHAGMGSTSARFGILPHDISTAQALSLFGDQSSMVFYNPAALAHDSKGELTGSFLHAAQELEADSLGGSAPLVRDGDVLDDTPAQQLLLGMKTNLTDITAYKHPLYLGFMVGTDKLAQELLAFSSETAEEGQFFRSGREPLFIALGFGTQLWRGIHIGATARITLESDASLVSTSDLNGETSNEQLNVSAAPVLRPIAGISVQMGDTFCTHEDCWLDRLDLALAWRGAAYTRVNAITRTEVPGTIAAPGLPLDVNAISSYQPRTAVAGVRYRIGKTFIGISAEFQQWSDLEKELAKDTIRDQANLRFDDIVIPRIGIEYHMNDSVRLKTGIGWEESPLQSGLSPDVNFLDNDRLIVGAGISLTAHELPKHLFMLSPIRLDFGYQFHALKERDFDLSRSGEPTPFERVSAEGSVHAFAGSITMKF